MLSDYFDVALGGGGGKMTLLSYICIYVRTGFDRESEYIPCGVHRIYIGRER